MSWNLPEWVEESLEFDNNRELQQHHVAEVLGSGERPYYTIRRVRAELEGEFDKDTIRKRLSEMEELGVVRQESVNNGTIYWLNEKESRWPIPPDVDVEPANREMTVREFFGQFHVQMLAIGVFVGTASGVVVLFGTFQSADMVSSPASATWILSLGLTAIITSYFVIGLALLAWALQKGMGSLEINIDRFFDREKSN